MKYYRLPVTGIDERIQALQDLLHDDLICRWAIPETQYQCFGRVNKMPGKKGYIPQAYMGDGGYHEVLLDDRYAVQSFFGIGDSTKVDGCDNISDIHCVFFLNLPKLRLRAEDAYGTNSQDVRGDVEAREAVQAILGQDMYGFRLTEIITSVQASMKDYAVGRFTTQQVQIQQEIGISDFDVHPYHIFRVNGNIRYPKPHQTF